MPARSGIAATGAAVAARGQGVRRGPRPAIFIRGAAGPWGALPVRHARVRLGRGAPLPSAVQPMRPLRFLLVAASAASLLAAPAAAQERFERYADAFETRRDRAQPDVRYLVRVAPGDWRRWHVEMRVRLAADTVRLRIPTWAPGAYRTVPFHRYVEGLTVTSGDRALAVAREDSSTWRVAGGGRELVVRYRVTYPGDLAARTPNNRSFLRETGGLLDGPAAYLYVDGHQEAPAHVAFDLPAGWRIATGLVPTADARIFFAPSYDVLIDAPVLVGQLHVWPFEVAGVPHRVAYWPLPDRTPFDSAAFVDAARRIVEAGGDVMGWLPYREYVFLYVDGAGGGLEHLNSTTIGAASAALARNPLARKGVTAHEFFHTWNVKRLRPAILGPFDYRTPQRTTSLWLSEGVTDYFAGVLLRRAGLTAAEEAREELAGEIRSYLDNPGHRRVSPERSSWTAWDPATVNDGYALSYYLSGTLLGFALDVELRARTEGRRGLEDAMRTLVDRYAGRRGFSGEDVVRVMNETCGCDLQRFFSRHVAGAEPIPVAEAVGRLGWRLVVTRDSARTAAGVLAPDLRVGVLSPGGIGSAGGAAGQPLRIALPTPEGAWGRAGVLSGDEVVEVAGRRIDTPEAFRGAVAEVAVGDTVAITVRRAGGPVRLRVPIGGYETTRVRLEENPSATPAQQRLRAGWLRGWGR